MSSYYYPPSVGGLETQSHLLARELVVRGHSVRVISARLPGFAPRERLDGVDVERVTAGMGSRWRKMGSYLAAMVAAMLRRRGDVDVVQVQQALYPAAAAAAVQPLLGVPLVVRNSGSGVAGAVSQMRSLPLGTLGLRMVAARATTVSLNDEMTAELRDAGFRHIVTIANGVAIPAAATTEQRREARAALGLGEERVVLYIGRLESGEKDLKLLIGAFRRIEHPTARLLLVGDGSSRAQLEKAAAGDARVRFCGFTDDPRRYYRAADLFAMPSRSEGLSNALLEAMAFGLPAVATAVGGNQQVISAPSLGRLTAPGDEAAMASALRRLLDEPETARAIGRAAREHVRRGYSVPAMVDAYERLYARLVAAGDV